MAMAQQPQPHPQYDFHYQRVELFKTENLGIGSYGAVCKARCDDLPCAAKILHPTLFEYTNPEATSVMQKFEQECRLLSAIKHPHIVQYLGTYHDPESRLPVLLMELMDESLTQFLERSHEALPYHTEVNLCHDIVLALSYLHSNDIVHRDLSSNNVLLIAGSRAKVTDFGMVKLFDANRSTAHLTPLTLCPGTVVYMSPEALRDRPVYTAKLDSFSFGVLLVQIMTGQFPDPGDRFDVMEISDPRIPSGRVQVEVSEVDRRQSHIDLIDPAHPLLQVALDCLKDREEERPSTRELCHQVARLKLSPQYTQSVQQSREGNIQNVSEGSERQIRELRQQHAQEARSIQSLQQQLQVKDNQLLEKDNQLQQQQEEIRRENQQILRLRNLLIARNDQLQTLQQQLSTKDEQLAGKIEQLAGKDEQLAGKEEQLVSKDQQLQQKEAVIAASMEAIQQLRRQLQSSEKVTAKFQQKLQEKEKTIQTLQTQNQKLQQQLRQRESQRQKASGTTVSGSRFQLSCRDGGKVPYRMYGHVTAVDRRVAYFHSDFDDRKRIFTYNSVKSKWSELPECPPYSGFTLAMVNGFLTAIGGFSSRQDQYGVTSSLISLIDYKWTEHFPPMPTKRWLTAAVCGGKSLVVAGGLGDYDKEITTVEVMDTETLQWSKACGLPHPLIEASAVLCGDQIYVLAGCSERGKQSKSVFNCPLPQSPNEPKIWDELPDAPVTSFTCVSLEEQLLTVGGYDSDGDKTDTIHTYNTATNSWEVVGHMAAPRIRCLVAVLPNSELMIVGGFTLEGLSLTYSVEIATTNNV